MKRAAHHHWTENDDIVAVYLYQYRTAKLDVSLDQVTHKLGMSTASMKKRMQNAKWADLGIGLSHTAKQTRSVFDHFGRLPERVLRAKVKRYLASAIR